MNNKAPPGPACCLVIIAPLLGMRRLMSSRVPCLFRPRSGEIPASYASLGNLRTLNLSRNKLQGSLPSFLEANEQLEAVDLSTNLMRGQMPEVGLPLSCGAGGAKTF